MKITSALLTIIFVESTNHQLIENCAIASYCDNDQACSANGNCFIDIFNYYNKNFATKNKTFSSCKCNKAWDSRENDETKCCYKKKFQSIAFGLELMVGFGSGHFYIGNTIIAFVKLSCNFIVCFTFWLTTIVTCNKEVYNEVYELDRKGSKSICVLLTCISIFFIWQIIDTILFGINFYKDSNGFKLDEW
jgi:hypothetical protein